ncbi:toxin-antitoxin system YwqK family antitoxin [Cetobacterium sp. 2A]|uniref:toxin-antitoxin system YwqK family antitoxin n=1 Tax=Cetobacterium sp. 2A TaxID=2754723 RepID=UPI00163CBA24|nr:toxin-antitoxin system YwqK family antitoxin [Cetobacterium sp. 2A]MBC2857077.1 toxin-antitoxin system YwqK family antitoxin [Cetobacterium sp. 2A]
MKKNNMFFKNYELDNGEGYFSIYYLSNDVEVEYLNISYNSFMDRDENDCSCKEYYLDDEYALEYWEFFLENTGVIRSIFNEASYEDITFNISDKSIIKIEVFENETNNLISQRVVTSSGYNTLVINPALKEYGIENFEFVKNGSRFLYNEKDILLEEQEYKDGEIVGTSKYYYEDGSLKFLMNSTQTIEFYETGELKSKSYRFKKFSKVIDYYPNGNIMNVGTLNLNNEYEGMGWTFYENGQLKKICSYVNNLIDGEYKDYYKNGVIKTDSFYILGKENCEFKSYYDNGQIECIVDLEDGKRCGKFFKYYKSGQLQDETYYSNNAPINNSLLYYENGNLYAKLAYKNRLRVGISQWFYETGELQSISKYDLIDGYSYLNYSKSFYKSGEIKSYIQWEDALCEHNQEDYSYNIIRGYEILDISYYESGNLRKKQKIVGENKYSVERYDENEILTQKGTFFKDKNVFYWIGELLTLNQNKSLKIVTNYSEVGKFINTQTYLNKILDNTTIYLSDENVYRFISYYPNGRIKEEGYYIYDDNYNHNDISWIENPNFYSEEGELIEYEK